MDRYSGGPEDTLTYDTLPDYQAEAHWAAGILAMYEAALNGEEEAARDAVLREHLWVGADGSLLRKLGEPEYARRLAEDVEEIWDGSYATYALETALDLVALNVQEECLPVLRLSEGGSDPSDVDAGWAFKSLYGAMYLQMYWLMAAGDDVTRCKYCGRIISLASPTPGSRKTRQDKKFCNNACRQRYHYHTKTKPRRQSESR
jgi:hypothetical protein